MTKRSLIWLVDDTPLEADVARRTLEPTFEVRAFVDGNAAIEELANGTTSPDLAILDWHMPGITGIELCRFLRANPETQTLPILMLTSNDRPEDLVEALTSGADDYVRKPHQPAELMARVAVLLRSHALPLRAQKAERAVRSLLSQLPDAVLAVDESGRVAFANEEAQRVFPMAGLTGQDVRAVLPTLEPSLLSLSEGQPRSDLRDVSVGDRIYAPILGRVQLDEAPMTTITLRDVTDKHHEAARRLDFYSIIAHDLRAPLHAMSMRAHLLLDGARGVLADAVRLDLQKISDRIKGLALTINDFLDLAQLDAKSMVIETKQADLRELIDEAVEVLAPLAEAKRVGIVVSERAKTPAVAVDRRRIGQAIANLLSNAIKFSPEQGEVVIQLVSSARGTEMIFQDSGPGIPPEQAALLFQRYVRVAGTKVAGTGLGLMIVREVIEAHGGSVHVTSEVGRGSSFSFLLPHAPSESAHG